MVCERVRRFRARSITDPRVQLGLTAHTLDRRARRRGRRADPRVQLGLTAHTAYATVKAVIHHFYENSTGADRLDPATRTRRTPPNRISQRCNSPHSHSPGEWREGTSPSRSLRTVRDSLPSYGSHSSAWG